MDIEFFARLRDSSTGLNSVKKEWAMEDDDFLPSPFDDGEGAADDQSTQFAWYRTYWESVPYECESVEEMNAKLAQIIDKIYICSKSNQWHLISGWNNILNSWILMRYPLDKAMRIKLIHYYYELCLVPGIEPALLREFITTLSRLLPKRRAMGLLKVEEVQLEWQPLWRVLKRELWPLKRIGDLPRNVVNLLLYLAERIKQHFPANEISNMLNTFLPLLNKQTVLIIIPVLTSFLPLSRPQEYLPVLFSVWETFNSKIVDDRLIELMADMAEEHVSGTAGSYGEEGSAPWSDVGIWSETQWTFLVSKCLGSMKFSFGGVKGASLTADQDDTSNSKTARIKKAMNKFHSLAKLIVYSMSTDGPVKAELSGGSNSPLTNEQPVELGYTAGCKALDSLEKLINCTENLFHPNAGAGEWTLALAHFLYRLATEFCKRWKEEEDPNCKTPASRRLTPAIRRTFVLILRTPMLSSLFSKHPAVMGLSQGALRSLTMVEPSLLMPLLLERAYSGLEVVNETHRTTAVLSMLSAISMPLVTEKVWRGGQRHLVPLLELCIPGIDLNDPAKTVCATMFICAAVQHIKIGDLSMHAQSAGALVADDSPSESNLMDVVREDEHLTDVTMDNEHPMDVVMEDERLPFGIGETFSVLSRAEEQSLVRDSTAGFADWVTSLFRRVFALYENLPEEGGKRNTTGGKQEEGVLKAIKNTLDVVCLHLSDQLFDLVLRVVYDYATTNAKSNAVRAFGQLIGCLARVKPQKTLDRFLPFCARQIKEELKHGASSVQTTSTHVAVPSDTTLHWNMTILRGCLSHAGNALLKHKDTIIELIEILVDNTKSERGYSGTGQLITRLLHTISTVYPLNSRFVNTEEWGSEGFDRNHNVHWGRMYEAKDVKIEWHVPSPDEIAFVLEVLERIVSPLLLKLEVLLGNTSSWDNSARNDFCRYLYAVRSAWAGLPAIIQKDNSSELSASVDAVVKDGEEFGLLAELLPSNFNINAGFVLTDPQDPRYQAITKQRAHFGRVIHTAAVTLRGTVGGEDHIDCVISVTKAIEIYLLEYGVHKSNFLALVKNLLLAQDSMRIWPRQKANSRLVFLKRAQVYHNSRLSVRATYLRRSAFDILLFDELIELSLSPYTRVRRHGQSTLTTACEHYPLGKRHVCLKMVAALGRGSDPDRMKGALYVLSDKEVSSIVRNDRQLLAQLVIALLKCQHQGKPSIQKLVVSVMRDVLQNKICKEALRKFPPFEIHARLNQAVEDLRAQLSELPLDFDLVKKMSVAGSSYQERNEETYNELIADVVAIAREQQTHWRYLLMAVQSLHALSRRDVAPNPDVAKLFMEVTTKSHPLIRGMAQKGAIELLAHIKIRSYSKNEDDLWFEEWRNPLKHSVPIDDAKKFMADLQLQSSGHGGRMLVDKITSGFLAWDSTMEAYSVPVDSSLSHVWEPDSRPALDSIESFISQGSYFSQLILLWAQEETDSRGDLELRLYNVRFMKSLAKMVEDKYLDQMTSAVDPLLAETDRFKQRAAVEFIFGLLRGSKHWKAEPQERLWKWFMTHLQAIFVQLKPDTIPLWESLVLSQLTDRDPYRNRQLIDWILALPLEFHSDSAFSMSKSLVLFSCLVDAMGIRFSTMADKYIDLLFDNVHTSYAEIRTHISYILNLLINCQWHPSYPSVASLVDSCKTSNDPLFLRQPRHIGHIESIVKQLPLWKEERLPPPRTNQSHFDKVTLSVLTLTWTMGHSIQAPLMFAYVLPLVPEIMAMTDLNDNPELSVYINGTLFLLSAISTPRAFIEPIADGFISTIKSTSSWKIKSNGMPILAVFFYKNLTTFSDGYVSRLMDVVMSCLGDENVEVREMAAKVLSGLFRDSQRRSILPFRDRFVAEVRSIRLPNRHAPGYAEALRALHSAILGVCALVESFPHSVEPWMPPLTDVLAPHVSDPPPISTTIRKCASEFKKTHQDTWHTDQLLFDEDQLQSLSSMLIGTSYYA